MQRFFHYFAISIAIIIVFNVYIFLNFEIKLQEALALDVGAPKISVGGDGGTAGDIIEGGKKVIKGGENTISKATEDFEKSVGIDLPFSLEEIQKDPKKLFLIDPSYINVMKIRGLDPDPVKALKQLEEKRDQIIQKVDAIEKGCAGVISGKKITISTGATCAITVQRETSSNSGTNSIIEKNTPPLDFAEMCSRAGFDKWGESCTKVKEWRSELLQWWDSHYSQFNCGMKPVKFTDSVDTLKKIAKDPNSNMKTIQCVIPYTEAINLKNDILGKIGDYIE